MSALSRKEASQPATTARSRGLTAAPPSPRISRRAFVLAAVLVPANAWWLAGSLQQISVPGALTIFGHLVLMLFVMAGVNCLAARGGRLPPFTQAEMLFLYITLALTTSLMGGYDFIPCVVQVIHAPFAYARPGGDWPQTVWPYLPVGLTVRDPRALDFRTAERLGLYHLEWGRTTAGPVSFPVPSLPILGPWVGPVLAWTLFFTAMLGTSLCLAALVRQRWMDQERLAFPLIRLPLALTEPGAPPLRKWAFWVGFGVSAGLSLLNGLHLLFPSLPELPVQTTIPDVIGTSPLPVTFFPFVIGLAFLIPLEMLFSLWFFAAIGVWQRRAGAGADAATWYAPYLNPTNQLFGRYLAVAAFALWPVLRVGFKFRVPPAQRPRLPSITSPTWSPRNWSLEPTAGLGAAVGLLVMLVFCLAGGMRLWVALLFLGLYFAVVLAVGRLRAEMGPPLHDLWSAGPVNVMVQGVGPLLGHRDLGMLGLLYGFNRNFLAHPFPQQLEGFKLGQEAAMPLRPLAAALLLFGAWGILCTFWAHIHFIYRPNATWGRTMGDHAGRLVDWLHNRPSWDGTFAATEGFGFVTTAALVLVRRTLLGWPLHPMGLLLSGSWWMDVVTTPIFIAWLAKWPVMRYGGVRLYGRCLPFFMGLAVGDFALGTIWALLGAITGIRMYSFFSL